VASFYFLKESIRSPDLGLDSITGASEMPVKIRKKNWEHLENPFRIAKIYSFQRPTSQRAFVSGVMELPETWQHGIKITIEESDVLIETYTRDLMDVTEMDLQIARMCDQIFADSKYARDDYSEPSF
jgi:pterin-4a-carbinolamine dehydratase